MSNDASQPTALSERQQWLTFLLPFAVYMVVGQVEPKADGHILCSALSYPVVYAIKIALTLAAVAFVWPGYRQFPLRLSWLAIVVGIVGGAIWIALAAPGWERLYFWPLVEKITFGYVKIERPAFNPFDPSHHLATGWAWAFLVVRFLGLVAVIPLIEEFLLRGFVMRFVMERDWWNIPFGTASRLAIVVGTVFPMLSHPELLAAAVWFSMVTWLMLKTKNIWDCITAHAITNLILGIYVVTSGNWSLM